MNEKTSSANRDIFVHFPEPPIGMKLRVERSQNGLLLTGYHTISTAWHYVEKCIHLLFFVPFCFLLGVVGPLYIISRIVIFHEPVDNGDMGNAMPHWAALTFIVPFLTIFPVVFGYSAWHILTQAIKMTPDRPNWELNISLNKWRITMYHKDTHSDDAIETRELEPSHILKIGVDVGGRVYAEEAQNSNGKTSLNRKDGSSRVELTNMLPKNEALWVEHALVALLVPSSSSL